MYEREGPCCKEFEAARHAVDVDLRVLQTLGVNTPRLVLQFYENMSPARKAMYAVGTGQSCPCNEAPNPQAFRELMARTKYAGVDPLSDEGLRIADEVVKKYGMG